MHTENFLKTWRVTWYPRIVFLTLLASIFIAVLGGRGAESLTGRLGGDYPAFYAAGEIARQGDWTHLYNFSRQTATQRPLLPTESEGAFLAFAYPPFVALLYYPLSLMNFRLSFLVHTLLMVLVIAVALRLLCRRNPEIASFYELLLVATLLYYPMLRAVLGGQNTPIIFLLVVAVWTADLSRKEWLAGVFLGLMLFKPQYGIPLIGLHLLAWRWKTVVSSAVVAMGLYLISSYFCGALWIEEWLQFSFKFASIDASVNPSNSVSWIGFLEALFGAYSKIALITGTGLALLTSAAACMIWYKARAKNDLSYQLGVSITALLLIQPHAMYYDMGLVLFTYVPYLSNDTTSIKVVILMWLLGLTQLFGSLLGFSPLFMVLLCTGLMSSTLMWRRADQPENQRTMPAGRVGIHNGKQTRC